MIGPVTLTWLAADLKTGKVTEELRALKPSGPVSRKLGTSTTLQADLTLAGAPPGWESATDPGRTMLVPVDTATGVPLGAYIVLTREGGSDPTVALGATSAEGYFDRRYTGDYAGVGVDQALIMSGLATTVTNAPPFTADTTASGTALTYQLLDGDDRTVLSALQELAGMLGAPEWCVDVAWADAGQTRFVLPVRVRPKIGVQSTHPEVTFDFPGCIASYKTTESYEAGKGATTVRAYGDGEGAGRLRSPDQAAADLIAAGWAGYDYRFTPASGLADPGQLTLHAEQALAQMRGGASAWSLVATASRSPRLGTDWALGDSIHAAVARSPRHPAGADFIGRAYAWDLDPAADTVTPILVEGP